MIPPDIRTILDVGAGIGDNARALCHKGYSVTAISPDRNHARYFEKMLFPQLRFISSRLEDFRAADNYDLILMSESNGYFHMDTGFSQSCNLLHPGGYLLVSGMFCRDNRFLPESVNRYYDLDRETDYTVRAKHYDLHLIQRVDITDETLPTLVMAYEIYHDRLTPFLDMMEHYLNTSAGWKWKALKMFMWRQLRELKTIKQLYDQRLNPELFLERARYMRLLFQLIPAMK
jgi:cyclopropane fatty-acyl-phospholipid synthase-like methyltransferase